jgi:hypothetical protein
MQQNFSMLKNIFRRFIEGIIFHVIPVPLVPNENKIRGRNNASISRFADRAVVLYYVTLLRIEGHY